MLRGRESLPAGPGAGPRLHLRWEERGGPPVAAPTRRGFGSRLIERSLAQDLGGSVTLAFHPDGLTCTLEAPVAALDDRDHDHP